MAFHIILLNVQYTSNKQIKSQEPNMPLPHVSSIQIPCEKKEIILEHDALGNYRLTMDSNQHLQVSIFESYLFQKWICRQLKEANITIAKKTSSVHFASHKVKARELQFARSLITSRSISVGSVA